MSQEHDSSSGGFELDHFEKNRYFQGKLMTARDMLAEQQYHANRLETINRFASGTGILAGLTISEFEDKGEELQVTIEPGLAIDTAGRPVVVKNPTTRSVPKPEGGELYLYIEYDNEMKDPVPVPGEEPLNDEESEESRILEVFTVSARETAPRSDTTPARIEFPDFENTDKSVAEMAQEIVSTYHDERRSDIDTSTDTEVFIGSFKRTPGGEWRPGSETKDRPFVYDNEMLFSMLVSHVTDTENPHGTRFGDETDYIESELDQIEGLTVRLQQMRSDMEELTDKVDLYSNYTAHKSLKTASRFFDRVPDEFERQTEISQTALGIVNTLQDGIGDGVYTDREAYNAFLEDLLEDMEDLTEALDGWATRRTYQQYSDAVEELAATVGEEASVLELAVALDRVGEAADVLEKRTEAIPEKNNR
jgi:hypothetical protein